MPSIRESLTSLLGQGDAMAKLGTLIDGDAEQAVAAVDAAGPVLVGGLADTAAGDAGAETITSLLDDADPSILDDLDGFLDRADSEAGDDTLDSLFGADRDDLLDGLADQSGLGADKYRELLPMLAPIVTSHLAERRAEEGLDGEGIVALLSSEREELESDGTLGDWFSGLAGGGAALGALGGAAALTKDEPGDLADDVDDAAGAAKEKVSELADDTVDVADVADGVEEAEEAVSELAVDADDAVGGAAGVEAEEAVTALAVDADAAASTVAGRAKATVGATAGGTDAVTATAADASGEATDRTTAAAGTGDRVAGVVDEQRRGGLGWLWWAVGAVLVVLFLAWLLNQCSNDDDETTASGGAGTTAAVADDTTAAGADTEATDGAGAGAREEADLQALVDAAVPEGVTGAVAGDVVTLSGTVDSEEAKAAAEDAVVGVDGVGSVDNQIEVTAETGEGSDDAADDSSGDAPSAGSTLNEELGLDPIRFNYLSSRITPDSEAVLAEVVTYLEANENVTIEIQGHTDSDGTEAENVELSTARAEEVKRYLEANGIAADRMTTVGLGESDPEVPNDSLDNKAINRRIEFVVTS